MRNDVIRDVSDMRSKSHVGNWNLWQQFVEIENLLSSMMESYEI